MSRQLRTTLDIASVAIMLSLCMAAVGSACGSLDVPPEDGPEIQQDSAWSCTCSPKFPPAVWTPIAVREGWTAANLGMWKDPLGFVHLLGTITHVEGGQNPPFVFPPGYRPPYGHLDGVFDSVGDAPRLVQILSWGDVLVATMFSGRTYYMDGVSFWAPDATGP
jgi:hypothetical protein